MRHESTGRKLMLAGTVLVLIGMITGLVSNSLANPRMGLSSHLAALGGGTLLIALGAGWRKVVLGPRAERWAAGLLIFGNYANWLATFLAALWGAGRSMMPIAGGTQDGSALQEAVVGGLLISLSLAVIAGLGLTIKGLIAARD